MGDFLDWAPTKDLNSIFQERKVIADAFKSQEGMQQEMSTSVLDC